ncbi:hypothetical protein Tco_0844015 [Tanacetum coccineum]
MIGSDPEPIIVVATCQLESVQLSPLQPPAHLQVNCGQRRSTVVDHRSTVNHRYTTVAPSPEHCSSTAGPPQLCRRTAGQPSLTSAATSACGSHVSQRGTAMSADWVLLAHMAATLVADAKITKTTLTSLELETSRAGLKGSLKKYHLR